MITAVRLPVALLFVIAAANCASAQNIDESGLRPPATNAVDEYLAKDTMSLYWGANFGGGDPHQIHPVTQQPAGRPQDFEDQKFLRNVRDDMSSLKWNLPPGVIVVFYEDAAGKGEQIIIWGKGQIRSLRAWDFNDKVSRWAWYFTGGAEPPIANIDITPVPDANPMASPLPGSLQLWEDTDYRDDILPITDVTSFATGEFHRVPKDLRRKMSSLRWSLPPGVIVVFAENKNGTGKRITVWDKGQIPKLLHLDFNDEVSSWAWFSVVDKPLRVACWRCSRTLDRGLKYCPRCQAPQEQVKVCPFCSTIRPNGERWDFCGKCSKPWPEGAPG